ncbi:MAG: helix-turn-helix domain-containing protein [Tepidisphaerales bacterium]
MADSPLDTAPTSPEPMAMNATDTARMLGFTAPGFCNLLKSGRIGPRPARIGRCLRFETAEIRAWLRAGCPPRNRWAHMWPGGAR